MTFSIQSNPPPPVLTLKLQHSELEVTMTTCHTDIKLLLHLFKKTNNNKVLLIDFFFLSFVSDHGSRWIMPERGVHPQK